MNRKIIWERWHEPEVKSNPEEGEPNVPVIFTQVGYFSHKLYGGLKNDIRFWVGNTTWTLTDKDCAIIDATTGVEIFNILTGLKFRFSAGKAFKASQVREDLEINLGCENKYGMDLANIYSLRAAKLTFEKQKLPWLIFILPNGKWEWYQNKNIDEFNSVLSKYKEAEQLINGHIVSPGV